MSSNAVITGDPPRGQRGIGPGWAAVGAILIVTLAGATGFLLWDRYHRAAATEPATLTEADQALIAELSLFTYENCAPVRTDVRGVTASVVCEATGTDVVTELLVLQFADRSTMDAYMRPDYQVVAVTECKRGRFAGVWYYLDNESDVRGDFNCWQTRDGVAHISTSSYQSKVVVVATGTSLPDMYEWWVWAQRPDFG